MNILGIITFLAVLENKTCSLTCSDYTTEQVVEQVKFIIYNRTKTNGSGNKLPLCVSKKAPTAPTAMGARTSPNPFLILCHNHLQSIAPKMLCITVSQNIYFWQVFKNMRKRIIKRISVKAVSTTATIFMDNYTKYFETLRQHFVTLRFFVMFHIP